MNFKNNRNISYAILLGAFFPLRNTFIAWDTTRLASFGFFAALLAFLQLMVAYTKFGNIGRAAAISLIVLNLSLPSHNYNIGDEANWNYFWPGVYNKIDNSFK